MMSQSSPPRWHRARSSTMLGWRPAQRCICTSCTASAARVNFFTATGFFSPPLGISHAAFISPCAPAPAPPRRPPHETPAPMSLCSCGGLVSDV